MTKKYLLLLPVLAVALAGCSLSDYMKKSPPANESMMQGESVAPSADSAADDTMMEAGVMVGGTSMVPSKSIIENANNSTDHTTLMTAVQTAGLVETLSGPGPFTVFAPTDAAFKKLPTGAVDSLLQPAKKAELTKILTYHVVPGRYTSQDLKDGMKLKTVQGQELMVSYKNGKWMINGAMVTTPDVVSKNGVTFVIDSVLMPK